MTAVVITGSDFLASQGTGGVFLGDTSNYDTATLQGQTETAWSDTEITFTVVQGALPYGRLYVFVLNNDTAVSGGWPVTLLEPEPTLLTASDIAAEMDVILYDSGGNEVGGIVDLLGASITETINEIPYATFSAPFGAAGVSLGTVSREIAIRRIGEGTIFRGFIVKRNRPVDVDGVTVVQFQCLDLAVELQRMSTWRSLLLLAEAAQAGLDALLVDTGWTGVVAGVGYQDVTKDFTNQSRIAAVSDFATLHNAYWRRTAPLTDREIELKNYHSPSGIVLTNTEQQGPDSRLGVLTSIDALEEDGSSIVNRLAVEIKTDSSNLITLQQSTRVAPYVIQTLQVDDLRIIDTDATAGLPHQESLATVALGENRLIIAAIVDGLYTAETVPQSGGQSLDLIIANAGVNEYIYAGIPPKGVPKISPEPAFLAGYLAVTFANADPVIYSSAQSTATGTAVSVTVASEVGDTVIGIVILREIGTGTPLLTADNAEELIVSSYGNPASLLQDNMTAWQVAGAAGTTTLEWTISNSETWEAFALTIRPAFIHYIEHAASLAEYGVVEHTLQLGEFAEVELDPTGLANAAYDAAVTFLDRHAEPPGRYAAKAAYLPGTPLDWLPGDTMRFLPHTAAVDEDERLIVVERTHSYDADGVRTWDLMLSDKPQLPAGEIEMISRMLSRIAAAQANQV